MSFLKRQDPAIIFILGVLFAAVLLALVWWGENTMFETGAKAGYQQALWEMTETVKRTGKVEIKDGDETIMRLVPEQ